jgi:hypothetical protein
MQQDHLDNPMLCLPLRLPIELFAATAIVGDFEDRATGSNGNRPRLKALFDRPRGVPAFSLKPATDFETGAV